MAKNLREKQPFAPPESSSRETVSEPHQQEYDFLEEPPPEYFCPVTFELLRDPKQTECCGHHLSGNVVARLQREGKPCPLCKETNLTVTNDKYFKRKVEELKVRCYFCDKQNGCKWEGDLGNLDHHLKSCPKRPWQCQHCDFRGTYDIGTTDHLPNCTKYPELCPNQCDIGTVPRCDMEKHLTECPLQLVECEFAQAGCREKVPRQDLSRHMEEGAQRHLLSMSLLNLSLTRELHQKMAEKDQQIAELQGELQEQSRTLKEQFREIKELREQFQRETGNLQHQLALQGKGAEKQLVGWKQQSKKLEDQIQETQTHGKQTEKRLQKQLEIGLTGLQRQLQRQEGKVSDLQQKIQQQTKLISGVQAHLERQVQQNETAKQISEMQTQFQRENRVLQDALQQQGCEMQSLLQGEQTFVLGLYPTFKFTLAQFSVHKARVEPSEWKSDPFYSRPGGYKFKLGIDTNGYREAKGTHITADLWPMVGEHDGELSWPIQVTAHLQLLNQRGDHGHVMTSLNVEMSKACIHKEIARKFIAHSELEYSAAEDTQYLKDDCLQFRLYLKVICKA